MPPELRGAVHTTALSPDGRYVYIIGPSAQVAPPPGGGMAGNVLRSPVETAVPLGAPHSSPTAR